MILQYVLLTLGIICLAISLFLVMWPRYVAALPAIAGLVMLHYSYYILVPTSYLVFWSVAAVMVGGIAYMSPKGEPDGRKSSNIYIGLGAIAGALLGIIVSARFMVLGVILGATLGEFMYSRTPHGSWLRSSRRDMCRYFAAKCLPVIVAIAIVGIAVEGLIERFNEGIIL